MRGIWASIAVPPPSGLLEVVAHRGSRVENEHRFESPAGRVHFWQCGPARPQEGSAAQQGPWHGRFQICFDGCLYNSKQLARLLDAAPDALLTDADLVLGLYSRWGPECLSRLEGMFAFVVWDEVEKRLFAARDRYGLKPLYVHASPNALVLASEIKQILKLPGVDARLNPSGCLDFLIAGLTDHSERTLFQEVQRFPASASLLIDTSQWRPGQVLPPFKQWYWLPVPGSVQVAEAEAVEQFRHLLSEAVSVRWNQPAPSGLCLSGGLDSSAIAALLVSGGAGLQPGERLVTFKACFGEPVYDEPHLLQAVLERTGAVNHQSFCRGEDAMGVVEPLVWHMDEPFGRASLAAQWKLFEQARQMGIRSTLDGQGSDELLAGYMSMVHAYRARLKPSAGPVPTVGLSSRSSLAMRTEAAGKTRYIWLTPWWQARAQELPVFEANRTGASLGELCHYRVFHGDLPMMMRDNDRIGTAHGVETHVPFMDSHVVDFCIGLGGAYKIVEAETKYLLRRAMQHLLPPVVIKPYGKGSYSSLEEGWFRGPAGQVLKEGVAQTVREWDEILEPVAVLDMTRQMAQASKEDLMLLWRIFCFGVWARRFKVCV